ncbi:MAG: 4a-hydroxytetrahydrobiopterin dehydratase [Aphanocapsa lilacina HA4352-LM1]|jgi:4a-hydroxytetrahydrobiopterin dehydratase|nr:4a-hydroxytetrahydrobiopterin dehydratase [Aphanocapsa lilacina HA4352-LM1]
MNLTEQRCTACRPGAPRVSAAEIAELHPQIPAWQIIEVEGILRLERQFRLRDFREAIAFTVRVGEEAEAEGHHPALLTEYGTVKVSWWTHAIAGLHHNDFVMAAKTDAIAAQMGTV